jgi:hypothetical protein
MKKTTKKLTKTPGTSLQLDKAAIQAFLAANPTINLQKVNLLKPESIQNLNWTDLDQEALLPQLKGLQRLTRLTGDIETAEALYENGLHAAVQIASIPQHKFVAQYAGLFKETQGTPVEQAKLVHQRALARKSQAVLTYTAIAQHQEPHYRATRFANLSAATAANYGELPNYQDLFGNLDFCDCDDCRTIFSPAAYFVDLMRLQDAYINRDTDAHCLNTRRPDLENILLNCENTNTLVPQLQIVNKVLLQTLGPNATYKELIDKNYPFNLPFNLPLAQIQQYLSKNNKSIASMGETLTPNTDTILLNNTCFARLTLGISKEQWGLYVNIAQDADNLRDWYGLTSTTADPVDTLKDIDTFLKQTSLTYTELIELLYQNLSDDEIAQGLNNSFFINSNITGAATGAIGIDAANGQLTNLTLERLNHINRFVRLARVLGWSFTDLDWALRTIGSIVNTATSNVPDITNDILPYLAYMKLLHQESKFSINQLCALLGTVKDFGEKDGPSFFDTIFNSPFVPNPPKWKDSNGGYTLKWHVPQLSGSQSALNDVDTDRQIQNALAAALQLSQNDLIFIANQLLKTIDPPSTELTLTLQNLSILYRLSQLHQITGLSIEECFTALSLPGQASNLTQQLAGTSGAGAKDSILLLRHFAQWIRATNFKVYQLQFILTGDSKDATIQNQMLGSDKIDNFRKSLEAAITATLLTEQQFLTAISPALQQLSLASYITNHTADIVSDIWTGLNTAGYITGTVTNTDPNTNKITGIVTATGATITIDQVMDSILLPVLPLPEEEVEKFIKAFKEKVITLVVTTIQNSYQLQQQTLNQKLASLYNISPSFIHALKSWGKLTLADLLLIQDKDGKEIVNNRLKALQTYASLITSLALSPAEVQAMVAHPEWFGVLQNATAETRLVFTLQNIQTLYAFKLLIREFGDTENHLLSYFSEASKNNEELSTEALKLLTTLTQWNAQDIQILITALEGSSTSAAAIYATVTGIAKLKDYFTLSHQLNIDAFSLVELHNFILANTAEDYDSLENIANILWGGLQKEYRSQPDALVALQGKVDELKRNALLALVIFHLRNQQQQQPGLQLNIETARDLYEYLLIDVEVSGSVQTSYIKEAISAVQLYLYRCRNHLEVGAEVDEELNTWWPWMEHYRVWQANREVFLYPENYIQPELRTHTTDQFVQLANALQQSNLTESAIDRVIKTYIDGFSEVANLNIVGSYLYTSGSNEQRLYLVGRTTTKPYTYYYRTATLFASKIDEHAPVTYAAVWTPWVKIDLQIKSNSVSPVFAFNKLFLFWAETKQAPSLQDSTGKPTSTKQFEATLYYTFYDFNERWTAPQQLMDPILLPSNVTKQADAEADVWQQIRAVFISDTQAIYWSWGNPGEVFYTGTINNQLNTQINNTYSISFVGISLRESPGAVIYENKFYCFHRSNDSNSTLYCTSFSNQNDLSDKQLRAGATISGSPSGVVYNNQVYAFYQGPNNNGTLNYTFLNSQGNWEFKSVNGNIFNNGTLTITQNPSAVVFNNQLHCFYYRSTNGSLHYCKLNTTDNKWYQYQVNGANIAGSPSVVAFNNTLYCFYRGTAPDSGNALLYSVLQEDGTWQHRRVNGAKLNWDPSAVVFQGRLYCFYQGITGNKLWYAILEEGGENENWSNYLQDNVTISTSPSVVEYQNYLYCFYTFNMQPSTVLDGSLAYTLVIPPERIKKFLKIGGTQISLPAHVVPGMELTWSIETGPSGNQFLVIPGQDPNRSIRLSSQVVYELSKKLFSEGIDGFLTIDTQKTPETKMDGSKTATLDFSSANSLYYWELFFHVPFLIARALSNQQQFELAKKWYEYIFNPTISKQKWDIVGDKDVNDKYWRFIGLRSQYNTDLQNELGKPWAEEVQDNVMDLNQLAVYHNDPFDPHAIAGFRPIAYQKTIVMHYIDNLLNWGDNLFRQYTIENIVEATMLYVTAYDLLGKQPVSLGPCPLPDDQSLMQIAAHYDGDLGSIPEFLIQLEQNQANVATLNVADTPYNYIPGDYFGLPENMQFTAYWDKVRQRLYNIRHSLNINGIYQQLALFEPAINPMRLVEEIAAGYGVDSSGMSNQVVIPYYRFNFIVAKAQAMAQTVIQLGQSLLTVLEKKDAEELSLLYNVNQKNLLALTRTSKQNQLQAATQNVLALQASLQNAQDRLNHYTRLKNEGLSIGEAAQIDLETDAIRLYNIGNTIVELAAAGYAIPTIYGFSDGGFHPGDVIKTGGEAIKSLSELKRMSANLAGIVSGYQRRDQDWQLQQTLAQDDLEAIQYQILAARYQESIAQQEIDLLEAQVEQEQAVEKFLKNKFTRSELYQWMMGKISALYFQAYQLAYNLSLQAQQAWQYERCNDEEIFVQASYWNDLHHGLVAGEALQLDLQRMEKAYMDKDERKFEIEKTISLAQLDPKALEALKATGSCNFSLKEKDFDYDYPGHYCRQIKSISISLPTLLGAYQDIHATLTQTTNRTLLKADIDVVKYLLGLQANPIQPKSDILRTDVRANQQVALSRGINDSGLFMLNFEDVRYLPFEGTGAVSDWKLEIPHENNAIDFTSLTDVVIRLQYTALSAGTQFRNDVRQLLGKFNGVKALNIGQNYASDWYNFIQENQPLILTVGPKLFRANLTQYKIESIAILLPLTAQGEQVTPIPNNLSLSIKVGESTYVVDSFDKKSGMLVGSITELSPILDASTPKQWEITVTEGSDFITAGNVSNMIIVLSYTATFPQQPTQALLGNKKSK